MEDLIKSLRIFEKYCDDYHKKYPFCCDHDIIVFNGAGKDDVTPEDVADSIIQTLARADLPQNLLSELKNVLIKIITALGSSHDK